MMFTENSHTLVRTLFHQSDRELLTLFQNYPNEGKYFTAIFCRYGLIVQTLIQHSIRSPVQSDYLFSQTWRHIFHELRGLDLRNSQISGLGNLTLQNWLINQTSICIERIALPPVESIRYSLKKASPPLWCYTLQALDQLPPRSRLITLMSQTFHWSESRISAYLLAEGESIAPTEIRSILEQSYQTLENLLPSDIKEIYLHND